MSKAVYPKMQKKKHIKKRRPLGLRLFAAEPALEVPVYY